MLIHLVGEVELEIVGRNMRRGPIQICYGPYCVRQVDLLRKSTDFHDMRTECQIIIINFFLLIYR